MPTPLDSIPQGSTELVTDDKSAEVKTEGAGFRTVTEETEQPRPKTVMLDQVSSFKNEDDPDYVEDEPKDEKAATSAEKDDKKQVPLSALEDERGKRQKLEEELAEIKSGTQYQPQTQQQQEVAPQLPDPVEDPEGYAAAVTDYNIRESRKTRLAISLEVARSQHADYEDMEKAFVEAVKEDPSLREKISNHAAPAFFAYKEGKAYLARKEIGDPEKYREKITAELKDTVTKQVLADLREQGVIPAEGQRQPTPRSRFPQSLSDVRSAAPRSNGAFSGPTPLGSIPGPGTRSSRRSIRALDT